MILVQKQDVCSAVAGVTVTDRQEILAEESQFPCDTARLVCSASSLVGDRAVRGRPAFTSTLSVTFPVSQRRCYNRRKTYQRLDDVDRDK